MAIPANGVGQVSLSMAGSAPNTWRDRRNRAVARGTQVVVTALGGDSVVVQQKTEFRFHFRFKIGVEGLAARL